MLLYIKPVIRLGIAFSLLFSVSGMAQDLNGDGKMDVVFAQDFSQEQVCAGDGSGGFECQAIRQLYENTNVDPETLPGLTTMGVALGDVDGNGSLDAVFAVLAKFPNQNYQNYICYNVGSDDQLCLPLNYQSLSDTFDEHGARILYRNSDVALADFMGNGLLGPVFANGQGWTILNDGTVIQKGQASSICPNIPGSGGINCLPILGEEYSSTGVATGDFNGNGRVDVIFANSSDPIRKCINNGTMGPFNAGLTCSTVHEMPSGEFVFRVETGDLNGNGHLDLAFAGFPNNLVCLNDGAASFSCSILASAAGSDVAIGDLDNDGIPDLVFSANGPDPICLGNGDGTFDCSRSTTDTFNSEAVALGDINGDGFLDAVVTNFFAPANVCLGNGTGNLDCSASAIPAAVIGKAVALSGRSSSLNIDTDFSGGFPADLQDDASAYSVEHGVLRKTSPSVDNNDRQYIRTARSDYNTVDFLAEVSFTTGDPANLMHFIGMGPGERVGGFNEPTGILFRIHPPGLAGGRVDAGYRTDSTEAFNQGIGNLSGAGPHRAQILKRGNKLTLSLDVAYDQAAGFMADMSETVLLSDLGGYLDASNSHIYFGTSSTFDYYDDLSIQVLQSLDLPPVITVPAGLTFEADMILFNGEISQSALIEYEVSAFDGEDGPVDAVCFPRSGVTVSPGETTVNCTATDSAGNVAEASFVITVLSAADQVSALSDLIADLDADLAKQFSGRIDGALTQLEDGRIQAALGSLGALKNQINAAVRSRKLSREDGEALTSLVDKVINNIRVVR